MPASRIIITILLSFICLNLKAQTTIVLQPGSEGKDSFVWSFGSSDYGDREDMNVYTWTNGGSLGLKRALIEFDLSEVPDNAVITSAFLSIYYNPNDAVESFDSQYGNNAIYISRITSGWSENTVKWNNQPASTTENQISLPASTSSTQDYLDIDVTNLVNEMLNDNNGFVIRMQNENNPYRGLLFASSDHPNENLHPKLVITYIENNIDCITLKPGPDDGKDVLISLNVPNNSYPYPESNSIYTWTNGGSVGIERSLIEFDFSSIPEGAYLISSELSLYYNPTDEWQSFDYHTGDNAAYIQRILEPWDQYSVTWNNKPELSTENQVWLAPSTSPNLDYLNIDVAEMVRDMLVSPSGNNGFSIRMEDEQNPYRSLLFASSNHPNSTLRPELKVCWRRTLDIVELNNSFEFDVFPNPGNGVFNISIVGKNSGELNYDVININGQSILSGNIYSEKNQIDLTGNSKGFYFLRISNDNGESFSKKILLH